ncbi:hypothetical protein BT93_J1611 [Corymbia citriodora subsp. variegata]|nr:hypothetical protein BT93_J1611 [Corymbia citriodora subsp. variegata]
MRTLEDVRIVLAKPAIDNPIPVSTEISGYQSFDTSFYPRAAVDVEPRGYTHRRNPSNWPRTALIANLVITDGARVAGPAGPTVL